MAVNVFIHPWPADRRYLMKMLRCTQCGQAGRPPVRARRAACVTHAAATAQADVRVRTSGSCTVQGTSRKRNEDRLVVNVHPVPLYCRWHAVRIGAHARKTLRRIQSLLCTAQVSDEVTEVGEPFGYAGVFDGHGVCSGTFYQASPDTQRSCLVSSWRCTWRRRRRHGLLAGGQPRRLCRDALDIPRSKARV